MAKTVQIHKNFWPWGESVTCIWPDGCAMVELSFSNDNKGVAYLSGLSVIPEMRRKGVATTLMMWAEDYCENREIFRIDLSSVKEQFVMDFYHKLGYIDIKEDSGFMMMYKMIR